MKPIRTRIMVLHTLESLGRVCSVISTVLTAASTLDQSERRELSLRMAAPGNKTGGMFKSFIQNISGKMHHDMSGVALAGMYMLLAASSLLPGANAAAASSAANRAVVASSADSSQAAVLRGYLNKLLAHPSFANILTTNFAIAEKPEMMFSKATNALDHMHQLSNGGGGSSPYYPFTNVDAGWFIPDGCLTDIITKGMVAWCENTAADQFRLDLYTQLHTLRLCVYRFDEYYEDLEDDFATRVIPKINALPMLRELHLCRTSDEAHIHVFFSGLKLPHLTRLVFGKGYSFFSFQHLAHLRKLQEIAMALNGYDWDHAVYELDELASVRSLRSLEILNLHMLKWQNIHRLTALTSLRLWGLQEYTVGGLQDGGNLRSFILPDRPMPNLRELDLIFGKEYFTKKRENAQKSDATINWILENGAATFPAIETMRLGVLQFPAPLDIEVFTVHVAAHLMDTRVQYLLGNAPKLTYLAIEQARVQEDEELDAAIQGGEYGNALEKEIAIKTGGSQSVKWQTEVQFNIFTQTERSVTKRGAIARFEYTRKKE